MLTSLLPAISNAAATLTDDTQVHASPSSKKNYGKSPSIRVNSDTLTGLLRFNLTDSLPDATTGSSVGKAVIKLWVKSVQKPGAIDVYRITGDWKETTATGTNSPQLGDKELAGAAVETSAAGHWLVLDVTQLVKAWLDGTADNQGIALKAVFGGSFVMESKEALYGATLDILLTTGERGAQGLPGPQVPRE